MKTSQWTPVAVAAFSVMCALAQGALAQVDAPKTRAEVMAETAAARAAGTLHAYSGEDSGSFHLARAASPGRSRAEVVAELAEWRASGAADAFRAEFEGLVPQGFGQPASTLTRAQVQAEVLAARASGELHAFAGEDSGSFHLDQRHAADAAIYARRPATAPALVALRTLAPMCASPAVGETGAHFALIGQR